MALTGFERQNEQMEAFEKSELYEHKYQFFLLTLQGFSIKNPITSKDLEAHMGISGSQVRNLVNHARLKGIMIGSDGRGYFKAKNSFELKETIKHLTERRNALDAVISALQNAKAVDDLELGP